MEVDILLASYNGELYIEEQIESLLSQTYQNWRLLIHDDSSSDGTICIIKKYQKAFPGKIIFFDDGIRCGGSKNNFAHLMSLSSAPYVMFCDQDDIWLKNKIEITFKYMKIMEKEFSNKPVIIHSDLTVVDESLNIISDSMLLYQHLSRNFDNIKELLVNNNITGCAMMINREALNLSLPIPDAAIMHDWWIGCKVLKHCGKIYFIDKPLIKYRQHNLNAIGAERFDFFVFVHKIVNIRHVSVSFANIFRQAKEIDDKISVADIVFAKICSTIKRIFIGFF